MYIINFLTYQFTFKNFSSEGDKYKKAKEWKVPTVSIQWLNDVFFGFNAVQCMNNPKYQNFRLEDPFRIEYTLVPNPMVSWKTPIRVTSVIIWFIFFYNIISICTYHFFQIFFSFSAKIVELIVHIQKNFFSLLQETYQKFRANPPARIKRKVWYFNIYFWGQNKSPEINIFNLFFEQKFFSWKWHLL